MKVAVLGGGLQGACVAMDLASSGIGVDLYDKNDRCMSQASLQNEGKIHLGYLYANDRSLMTARTMIKGAITFASLMREWVGTEIDSIPVSTPFHYVVHSDSLLSTDEVERHLRKAHSIVLEESRNVPIDYFGVDYRRRPARISDSECAALFDRRTVTAAYKTAEVSIDPVTLAETVRARLSSSPNIQCRLRSHVTSVEQDDDGVMVDFEGAGVQGRERYDHVVNALWDGRLAVDQTVGLQPGRAWLYRLKHFLRLRAPKVALTVPSTTIILGAFGDVVAYSDGSLYLSWYPVGMKGASSDVSPPAWPFSLDEGSSTEMRDRILDGLRAIVPSVSQLNSETIEGSTVEAGIIFAWGKTDIHDLASDLHQRHAIGPRSYGRYHTVDTGKLTMAPYFGRIVADRIRQES